jgi:putative hydrolase of the HAD superfamily
MSRRAPKAILFHFGGTLEAGRGGYQAMLLEKVNRVLRCGDRYDAVVACRIAKRFHEDSLRCLDRNRPLLKELSGQYRLGIVSNFYGNLAFLCDEIGYSSFFDTVIDSARIGVAKPHPAIFPAALERLNCLPEEALFVGDNPIRDMQAARGLAMPHVWLNTLDPKCQTCCEGDPVIRSLLELAEILGPVPGHG